MKRLVFLLLFVACTPKETTTSQTDATASAVTSATAPAASSAPAANAQNDPLPSHGDVAKQVRGEITKDNYKAELDKLEKAADEP